MKNAVSLLQFSFLSHMQLQQLHSFFMLLLHGGLHRNKI